MNASEEKRINPNISFITNRYTKVEYFLMRRYTLRRHNYTTVFCIEKYTYWMQPYNIIEILYTRKTWWALFIHRNFHKHKGWYLFGKKCIWKNRTVWIRRVNREVRLWNFYETVINHFVNFVKKSSFYMLTFTALNENVIWNHDVFERFLI